MLESFVITLREGVEAALVIGIILAYLRKTGRAYLNKYAYWGLALSSIASVGLAVWFFTIHIEENELISGYGSIVAGLLVGTAVLWMWRTGRRAGEHLRGRMERIIDKSGRGEAAAGLGILLLTFLMIFREGAETIVFLRGLSLAPGASSLTISFGGLAGIGVATLFGYLFIKGALSIDLRNFFTLTSIVLLMLVLKLIATGVHELSEGGYLPSTDLELLIIGYLVRDLYAILILMALVAIPTGIFLWEAFRSRVHPQELEDKSPAERRLVLAELRSRRRFLLGAGALCALILLRLGSYAMAAAQRGYNPKPIEVASKGEQEIRIPFIQLEEGRMVKYLYRLRETGVRFILIKEGSRVISVFDDCPVCPPLGYAQLENGNLYCLNCNTEIALVTVGQKGGCNPIPLPAQVGTGAVQVKVADLMTGEQYFR
jgi:FTR1 family protein